MKDKLLHTFRIFDEYEKRFSTARTSMRLREPWKEKDRQEILDTVKDVLSFDEKLIPEIEIRDEKTEKINGITVKHLLYESWDNFYGIASLYIPANTGSEKRPLVVLCPGHGENGRLTYSYQRMAFGLASSGAYVLANDNIGQGARSSFGHSECVAPFYCGLTVQGMIVAETMALIRYMKEQPFVDAKQIGACGNSGGGTLTEFLAALEPNISVLASSGYPSEFPYILQKERRHCLCNLLPHFAGRLEMWEAYSLFAPKPLLLEQGQRDDLIPIDYFFRNARKVRTVYQLMDKGENFRSEITETNHPWGDADVETIGGFFAENFGLEKVRADKNIDLMDPKIKRFEYPQDAVTTDELAQKITGKRMPDGTKFEDVFAPKYQGNPISRSEIITDLGRGDVMRVLAQFEASL